MKVKLISDFLDYYDHHFDRDGVEFFRKSRTCLSRSEIFGLLKSKDFDTPVHGICKHLSYYFMPESLVVLHLDEYAHCGEGKELIRYDEASRSYPDHFITEYLKGEVPGLSIRHLTIGNRSWLLEYKSEDDWRSNAGNVEIKVIKELEGSSKSISLLPLYAIDFVKDFDVFYAIDFNTSPGLKYTGMEDVLQPKEVAQLIKQSIEENVGVLMRGIRST